MCYDISFKVKMEEISDYFPEIVIDDQLKVPWPQYPHIMGPEMFHKIPILFRDKLENVQRLRVMEWGVIKHFEKEEPLPKNRNFNLNIMSEKIFDPKSYWYKIRYNLCLIPVTGTFEHRGILGFSKKVPYFIRPKDQSVFFLPGLYTSVEIPDRNTGEPVRRWTFGLMTRTEKQYDIFLSNGYPKQIHYRKKEIYLNKMTREIDMELME